MQFILIVTVAKTFTYGSVFVYEKQIISIRFVVHTLNIYKKTSFLNSFLFELFKKLKKDDVFRKALI